MLYLEDYLEMIEHLPQELRDRFTEMREMDLTVQNNIDAVEKRIRLLFSQCARGELLGTPADAEFNDVRKDYYKILEDADEKVTLANLMYDLVDRYLRRLDSELFKFKCELEADHNGITEILEKRSMELDGGTTTPTLNLTSGGSSQKENRFFGMIATNNHSQNRDRYHRARPEKRRNSSTGSNAPPEKRPAISNNVAVVPITPISVLPASPAISLPPTTPNLQQAIGYNMQHLNNSNSVPSPGTPPLIAMKHVHPNRKTTTNMNSTFDAIHASSSSSSHEMIMSRDVGGPSNIPRPMTPGIERDANLFNNQRRHKKKPTSLNMPPNHSSPILSAVNLSGPSHTPPIIPSMDSIPPSVVLNDAGLVVEQTADGEWTYDPNEPRYCICNQVSYGDMVACDNEQCPFEWFHYPCVGITQSPKGKWYCPKCVQSMKRRGARK